MPILKYRNPLTNSWEAVSPGHAQSHTHAAAADGTALAPVTVDASTSIKTDLLAEHTGAAGISVSHNPFPTTDSATDFGKSGKTWQHLWAEGIQFPATQVASANVNNLDDYEEGTWTPVWGMITAETGAATHSNQEGRYIKIGKQVMVEVDIAAIKGTLAGSTGICVKGLPFTVASNFDGWGAVTYFDTLSGSVGALTCWPSAASTFIAIGQLAAGGGASITLSGAALLHTSSTTTIHLGAVFTASA